MTFKGKKIILAIETSCDETACAVVEHHPLNNGGKKLDREKPPRTATAASVVKTQIPLHAKMGGVVPEAAARAHLKYIYPVVKRALANAKCSLESVDYIAVTVGPGLAPSLLVGVEFAKALSFATGKPIIPVNHMAGHLYSPFGKINSESQTPNPKKLFPMVSLIVSGGHTLLVLMKNQFDHAILGQTVDDAAGEAFDKVAKLLGLPYPGGPQVSKLADLGNPESIAFPRPMLNQKNYNFSFAGLKTSVLYHVKSLGVKNLSINSKQDICASFQQAVIDVLVKKTLRAATEFNAKSVSLSGGVAANRSLREQLKNECQKQKIALFVPPLSLTTDNAEMIGVAASFMLHEGYKPLNFKKIKTNPNLEL